MSDYGKGTGGTSPGDVKIIIEGQRSDYIVEVSPDFSADDGYNIYPTVAQGLARADALILGGAARIAVLVRPHINQEENLQVNNGVALLGTPGATFIGPAVPTAPLFKLAGASELYRIGIAPQGGLITDAVIDCQPTFSGAIIDLTATILTAAWNNLIRFRENGGQIVLLDRAYMISAFGLANESLIVADGDVDAYYQNLYALSLNSTALLHKTGSLVTPTVRLHSFNAEWGTNPGVPPVTTQANVQSVITGTPDLSLCTFADGIDSVSGEPAGAVTQDRYPQTGASQGTMLDALDQIQAKDIVQDNDIDDTKDNVAILAASVSLQEDINKGEYAGLLTEGYTNADDVNASASKNYLIENSRGRLRTRDDLDTFESYADTTALRAVWVPTDVSNTPNALIASGGWDNGKYMEITFDSDSDSDSVRKTYGTNQDWSKFDKITLYLTGTGTAYNTDFFIRIVDANSTVVSYPLAVSNNQPWTKYEIRKEDFPGYQSMDWSKITSVRFGFGSVGFFQAGTFMVDDIQVEFNGGFNQTALVQSCDALTNWATTDAVNTPIALNTTNPREGTGCIAIGQNGILSQGDIVSYTWPGSGTYGPISQDDTAIRLWYRARNVTTPGQSILNIRMEDENGDKVIAPLQPVLSSAQSGWYFLILLLSDLEFVAPSTVFDFSKIIKLEFQFITVSMVATIDIDWIQSGHASVITEDTIIPGVTFNQLKLWSSEITGDMEIRYDIDVKPSPDFRLSGVALDEVIRSIAPCNCTFGIEENGEWIDVAAGSDRITFRIVGSGGQDIEGVSILWRTV